MISVIIPTFNRPALLSSVLPSYLVSNLVEEVLLIDDCSTTENWQELLRFTRQDERIQCYHNSTNMGAPASRNIGIELAKSELLLLSEDDLELGDLHLEILSDHMRESGADIIAGRRIWLRIGETKNKAIERSKKINLPIVNTRWMDHYSNAESLEDTPSPLIDATMLIHRKVTDQVRYFEPFGGPSTWREESDFQLKAQSLGFKVVFCPHTCTFHHARSSASYGRNRLMGDIKYLRRIYTNNELFLERNRNFLNTNYPEALIFHSSRITSILYLLRKSFWLLRSELLRWYLNRKLEAFTWK